ncbi:MAG TPA: BON domain-containing protein [Candidatus Polarisedimenticolia bacterium]|jgi:osmotically-inducible protein OsmY|nr:BON domain-containing protein [Candidatus Polarisedimenticolia bacterium]
MMRTVSTAGAAALLLAAFGASAAAPAAKPPQAHPAKPPAAASTAPDPAPTAAPQAGGDANPQAAPAHRNLGGPGDFALREKLIGHISRDPDLAQARIDVILVNGGAVFSGSVPNWTLKRRVLAIAGTQRGIYNVTDQMTIPRGSIGDAEIAKAIGSLLADYKEVLGLRNLEVSTEDGVATLRGSVSSFAARVRAEEEAGTILGLQRVVNRLVPDGVPKGSDDVSIRRAVVAYLSNDREFPYPGEIDVRVQNGRVTLGGSLDIYLGRQQAGTMAALVGGVREVENQILVDPSIQGAAPTVRDQQ